MNETDITPAEVAEKLSKGEALQLIDVREPYEWSAGHIEGAEHVPLAQLPQKLAQLDRDRVTVMICRSGGRSERARQYLRQAGFEQVLNMTGGMQRWAREVDPTIRVA
ncbi:MAG TPA: rhodanese-like domain-containing protein [Thermoanaerobaculia bacterium]